jgi:hypothetical protein
LALFELILGEERSPQYGIVLPVNHKPKPSPLSLSSSKGTVDDTITRNDSTICSTTPAVATTTTTETKHPSKSESSKIMSLEDMEALLFDESAANDIAAVNDHEVKKNTNTTTNATCDTEQLSIQQQQQQPTKETAVTTQTNASISETDSTPSPNCILPPVVSSWIQCTTWEPCAIGTTFL